MDLERALTHPYVIETIRAFGVLMVLSWHQVGFSERGNVQYTYVVMNLGNACPYLGCAGQTGIARIISPGRDW